MSTYINPGNQSEVRLLAIAGMNAMVLNSHNNIIIMNVDEFYKQYEAI